MTLPSVSAGWSEEYWRDTGSAVRASRSKEHVYMINSLFFVCLFFFLLLSAKRSKPDTVAGYMIFSLYFKQMAP